MRKVKSIKEATEMVHMDRMLALHYMTTMSNDRCAALPANGPASNLPHLHGIKQGEYGRAIKVSGAQRRSFGRARRL
jgi:hypothetical protein